MGEDKKVGNRKVDDMNKEQITTIVDEAVKTAMSDYLADVRKWDDPEDAGIEQTFQAELYYHLRTRLSHTNAPGEFRVKTELKYALKDDRKDKLDLIIKYFEDTEEIRYFMELKFRRPSQNAQDLVQVHAYTDIAELEEMVEIGQCVKAYFIFLTDDPTYTKEAKRGARTEVPMHQGSRIEAGHPYKVTGSSSAADRVKKDHHEDGYIFRHDYPINWEAYATPKTLYYYLMFNID